MCYRYKYHLFCFEEILGEIIFQFKYAGYQAGLGNFFGQVAAFQVVEAVGSIGGLFVTVPDPGMKFG